jgi:hypothetical protein
MRIAHGLGEICWVWLGFVLTVVGLVAAVGTVVVSLVASAPSKLASRGRSYRWLLPHPRVSAF